MAEPEDSAQQPAPSPQAPAPSYKVGLAQPARAPETAARSATAARGPVKRSAVFVAHGMGQQIPFQTLNDVAAGLLKTDGSWSEPEARLVEAEGPGGQRERLQRIELIHRDGAGDERHVHIYEAYWAPLTEGRVGLRDVIGFLFSTGWNGLKKGHGTFQRWLFGQPWDYEVPIRIVLYLFVALLVVAALVSMNGTILLVSAARAPFQAQPANWLSANLFADLSTTLNFYLCVVGFFAAAMLLALVERKLRKNQPGGLFLRLFQALSLLGFIAVLFATVLAAVAMLMILYRHVQIGLHGAVPEIWKQLLGRDFVDRFNARFETILIGLLAVVALGLLLHWVLRTAWLGIRDLLTKKGMDRVATLVMGTLTLLLIAAAGALAYFLSSAEALRTWLAADQGAVLHTLRRGISWPVLLAVSFFVRNLLVQYVGDVAVYVTSHRLDRFQQLRQEIRDIVFRTARAVYARTEDGKPYDEIVVVGHSLGSAIVYDALNRLVTEEILARQGNLPTLNVIARTPLLLTFGSPLDKFAFLFALLGDSPGRQAVAATLQPLLQEGYMFRPRRWINIHSPWDIISGDLDFYDPPGSVHDERGTTLLRNPKRVQNRVDPQASTLLASHVEYWHNPMLMECLHKQVTT